MLTISQAIHALSHGDMLQLSGSSFVEPNLKEKTHRFLCHSYDREQIQKIADFIKGRLENLQGEEKQSSLTLAEAFIQCYHSSWRGDRIASAFDRAIAQHRPQNSFAHPKNQQRYQKWLRYGMPEAIYRLHPEFCSFMETSGLLSQMKVTRDTVKEVDGEPAILVQGSWTRWTEFQERFEAVFSRRYKETFIVNKKTSEVYTYLDNGKGLEPHHPYLTGCSNSISTLNDLDYEKVLKKAHEFIRPGEENLSQEERQKLNATRPFILQNITSYVEGPETRFHELIIKPKHPFGHLIIGEDDPALNQRKGEVYEVGFGWKDRVKMPFAFAATEGRFRSPDLWGYMNFEKKTIKKIVTNIAISKEEAQAFTEYTMKYHRSEVNIGNPVGFHLLAQNCSTYTRMANKAAGIDVPTEISLAELIHEVSPLWIARVTDAFSKAKECLRNGSKKSMSLLPKGLQNALASLAEKISTLTHQLIEAMTALTILPLGVALGSASGEGGDAFVPPNARAEHIGPTLFNWKQWFSLSSYQVNLPGILQRWQREQASTVIYTNPIKWTIFPE